MVNTASIEYIEEVFREDGRMDDYTPKRKAAMQERLASVAGAWDLWYRSLARRTYADYKFVVGPHAPERRPRYNVFNGKLPFKRMQGPYDRSQAELARIQPILDHYDSHWCGGSPEIIAYLWDWFALPLQEPGRKTGIAVVAKVRFVDSLI